MTKIAETINPLVLPRCDAGRDTPYASDGEGTEYRCNFTARYRVGDGNFCTRHAGVAALAILMQTDKDENLAVATNLSESQAHHQAVRKEIRELCDEVANCAEPLIGVQDLARRVLGLLGARG